ncbi:MAG: ribonuclease P protein component [Bacillota bacterium]|jgi:ribonuclease P protein component|nr:ribonuclease P protein component [Bacillota bacterium]HOA91612.1 ribonuclease P protein component [Bacillota bacterium]HPZ73649.1 ribonuclease P protein component [Bacillota bacterium]HQD78453.1 ribonuclease P protein component [Bacillota bacterium]
MERLRRNTDFVRVYEKGKYSADRYVVVHFLPNQLGVSRIGFSVSKKIGKSVTRNLVKRRLRAIMQKLSPKIKQGYDIVISARVGAQEADFDSLEKSLRKAIFRAFLFMKEDRKNK